MWDLIELLLDAVGLFGSDDRDRRGRRERPTGCWWWLLAAMVLVAVFVVIAVLRQ